MQKQPSVAANWSRKKLWTIRLLLILGGVLTGLLIAEVALRLAGYTYPVFYTPDPALGYALKPNMEGWYRKEGEAYVRINSAGLRDREHAIAKPEGTLRIAILGDSYAEALQVPMENAFWRVMEEHLRRACPEFSGGREIEVINFGVSGYGTAQELLMLRERVWAYAPDIVLLAVTTNNDITDNSRALKGTDEVPYFVYRGDDLSLDDSFLSAPAFRLRQSALNRWGRWIRDNSRAIQAIHQAHGALKSYLASRRAQAKAGETAQAQEEGSAAPRAPVPANAAPPEEIEIDNLIYREPSDPVWQEAWRVTEGLIALMRDEVEARGAQFLVVTMSNGIQVYPDPTARQAFMRRLGIADLFYPDRRLRAFGERRGITVFNLAPALQEYADRHRVFLHGAGGNLGNGHWNAQGHALAGEMLARLLCERAQPHNARTSRAARPSSGLPARMRKAAERANERA